MTFAVGMPNPQALKEELLQARVAAFYKHEERNDAREVDLLAREADLRLREADLRQREAKVAVITVKGHENHCQQIED